MTQFYQTAKKRFCFAEKGYLKQTKSKWHIDIYAKIDTCLSIPNEATKTLQLHFMFIYSTIWSLFWFFILKIFQYLPVYWISYKRSFGTLFSNIYIIKYLKTIRRIICVQQIYTNCLCVSKSRPFIGLMIIVKNLENTFF